jgi:hypothetical protein
MDEIERLRNADRAGVKRRTKPNSTATLGDAVKELMEGWITPQQSRFGAVTELWRQLLPAELYQHCRLAGISGGQLKVLVDSPSYMVIG